MSTTKKNIIFVLILLAAVTLFMMLRGDYSIELNLEDSILTVDGPEGFLFSADLAQLESISYSEEVEVGACISGGEKYGYRYGTWENNEFGQYQLCARTKSTGHIVLVTVNGEILAFNVEDNDTTQEFYRALKQLMSEEGYAAAA